MKNQKPIFAFLLAFFAACRLFGISFQGLDLSDDDRLLFRADFESQHALFVSRLGDLSLQQVTAFPERLELVENNRTIVAHNRFGAVKIPVSGGLPAPVSGFPSFAAGDVPLKGRLQEFAASADGRWILYVEPTSPAYGNLLLTETTSGGAAGGTAGGIKRIVSERVELPADDFPARWSPDSRLFVYSKNGRLYYFPILQDSAPIADERFRQIGPGGITAVLWGQQRDFFYLQGNTLYRIANPELFTRTIYGDFLSIGSAVGFLPIDFDSNFDRYWLAPDAGSILINKNGKGIFYFLLGEKQTAGAILPHTVIPRGAGNLNVLWPASGPPSGNPSGHLTVIAPMPGGTAVWRFDADGKASVLKNNPASSRGVLSPDGTRAVFWGETGVELWDYINWRLIQRLIREPIVSCAWISNTELVMGSGNLIEGITIPDRGTPRRRLICLSGAERFGFEEENNVTRNALRILAKSGADWYVTDGKNPWLPINNPKLRSAVLTSAYYRAYLDQQSTGPYKNIPMVRYTSTTGTVSLVGRHILNGAYTQERKLIAELPVALCFDLYDDDTGLFRVMDALRRFNTRATFFLNGDFIRRNPAAAAEIAKAGHETASLFYAPIDFSDARYRVSEEFISQGLARNEDEFFRATGKEFSLLWHPPYYRTSNIISSAASVSGYTTVIRNLDCGDWLARDEALRLGIRQNNASDMIEHIIEKSTYGAIIPIRLGLLPGGRDDYLYQRIDVLLDALVRTGCRIVPVSAAAGK